MSPLQLRNEQAQAYARVVQRWWWLPLTFALLSAIFVYAISSFLLKPTYSVSATLQVSTPNGANLYGTGSDATTAAVIMTTSPVLQAAARTLGPIARHDPGALFRASCAADANNTFVTCTTTGRDPVAAAKALNHLARTFVHFNDTAQKAQYQPLVQQVQAQIKSVQSTITGLKGQLAHLQSAGGQNTTAGFQASALQTQISEEQNSLSQLTIQQSNIQQQIIQLTTSVHFVNPANGAAQQISPHPLRNAALASIIGFAIGATLVLIFEYLDDGIRSIEELTRVAGRPILGTVPSFQDLPSGSRLVPVLARGSAAAEAYRLVRTNLEFATLDHDARVILITSASEGDGKTTTATNLAASAALAGRSVLLVDCDLRRAGLSRKYFSRDKKGLTSALLHGPTRDTTHHLELPNLQVVPTGPLPPNSAELLASPSMRAWLTWARENYDLVILDAPPILPVADTRGLAPLADSTILVVDTTVTDRRRLDHTLAALQAVGVSPIGLIVNRMATHAQDYGYYYTAYAMPADTHANAFLVDDGGSPISTEAERLHG